MNCKHDVNWLIGTADGIVCRKCGKVFPDVNTLGRDLEADRNGQTEPAPEEKPKKRSAKKKS